VRVVVRFKAPQLYRRQQRGQTRSRCSTWPIRSTAGAATRTTGRRSAPTRHPGIPMRTALRHLHHAIRQAEDNVITGSPFRAGWKTSRARPALTLPVRGPGSPRRHRLFSVNGHSFEPANALRRGTAPYVIEIRPRIGGPGQKEVGMAQLRALFLNCTTQRSPDISHTEGWPEGHRVILEATLT